MLFLRNDRKLWYCVLAAYDSKATVGRERSQGHAACSSTVYRGFHHPTGKWMALRPHARAPLARSDPGLRLRSSHCLGGGLSRESDYVGCTVCRCRGRVLRVSTFLFGRTHPVPY